MTTHKTGIGAPMPRKEDHRFLTGAGRFSDDIVVPEMLVGMFLRASVPHGEIAAIDVAAALAAPGVQAVLTAADIEDEITGPMPSFSNVPPFDVGRRDGGDATEAAQYPLASDRVRYLGEPVAFIVADTLARAQDALELISVDYRNLQAVMEIDDALDPGAEQIWPDAPGNISFEWETGEKATTDAAFDGAHHISRLPL
ncbi:MAG: xanthine dehydrogenase family protein molybdopterin-binding subunit, partial [Rhodospirillaceae bacterium]|nr:xanthine dehydrogenase family protein molybdopterin-binding subunit [Rhodospirillaceae bacterium]